MDKSLSRLPYIYSAYTDENEKIIFVFLSAFFGGVLSIALLQSLTFYQRSVFCKRLSLALKDVENETYDLELELLKTSNRLTKRCVNTLLKYIALIFFTSLAYTFLPIWISTILFWISFIFLLRTTDAIYDFEYENWNELPVDISFFKDMPGKSFSSSLQKENDRWVFRYKNLSLRGREVKIDIDNFHCNLSDLKQIIFDSRVDYHSSLVGHPGMFSAEGYPLDISTFVDCFNRELSWPITIGLVFLGIYASGLAFAVSFSVISYIL